MLNKKKSYTAPQTEQNIIKKYKKQYNKVVGIVLLDLQDENTVQKAIYELPKEVTLAMHYMLPNLQKNINLATSKGHDVLLVVPLEPDKYPLNDPGENVLLTSLDDYENTKMLNNILNGVYNIIGITHEIGSVFCSDLDKMNFLINYLSERGLCFFDGNLTPSSQAAFVEKKNTCLINNLYLSIDKNSKKSFDVLENICLHEGKAIGSASALGRGIEYINQWSDHAPYKGLKLVPLSHFLHD